MSGHAPMAYRRRLLQGVCAAMLLPSATWAACDKLHSDATWPEWAQFAQRFMQADGRVIDYATPILQTTSEGQSYAMFFALVANDRDRFAALWQWSRANLNAGSDKLPAWLWGKKDDGSYGIVDPNSASDADLWFAYALLEAARLWRMPDYEKAALALLAQVKAKEVVDLPGLGPMLLPGEFGFAEEGQWRLNPSYLPLPVLRRLAAADVRGPWDAVAAAGVRMLLQSSPQGFAPDWLVYREDKGFLADVQTVATGSYDAIRTYLWAGVTDDADPLAQVARQASGGMSRWLEAAQAASGRFAPVPEKVDTQTGQVQGNAPIGFSAALLPYLKSVRADAVLALQRQEVESRWNGAGDKLKTPAGAAMESEFNYYNSVLSLFGLGWMQGRYRFGAKGNLLPAWSSC